MVIIWAVYFFLFFNVFFLRLGGIPIGWLFEVMIQGVLPLGILTFMAGAWGAKLKQVRLKPYPATNQEEAEQDGTSNGG